MNIQMMAAMLGATVPAAPQEPSPEMMRAKGITDAFRAKLAAPIDVAALRAHVARPSDQNTSPEKQKVTTGDDSSALCRHFSPQVTTGDEHIKNTSTCSKSLHEYARHLSSLSAVAESSLGNERVANEGFPTTCSTCVAVATEEELPVVAEEASPLGTAEALPKVETAPDDREVTTGDDSSAVCRHLLDSMTPASTIHAMPSPPDLAYATLQLFHNDPKRKGRNQAEWVVKIRTANASDFTANPDDPRMREFYIAMSPGGPRRLSATIKAWIEKQRLTVGFLERFGEITARFNANTWMGLVSKSAVEGPKRKAGQSGNAKLVSDDQFATMQFNGDGTPRKLTIWLAAGVAPMVFDAWKVPDDKTARGEDRDDKAAEFYCYYDPDNVMLGARADAKALARYRAHDRELTEWNPRSAVGAMIREMIEPIINERMIAVTTPLLELIQQQSAEIASMKATVEELNQPIPRS